MWALQKVFYRCIHFFQGTIFKLLKFPKLELLAGPGSLQKLPNLIQKNGLSNVLLVTDKGITSLGLIDGLLKELKETGISCTVFDEVQPNPSIQDIESGLQVYLDNHCEAIIAFGGGSPIDCAKMIGARASNPKKSVRDMEGGFKIPKVLPLLFAVPTTAGTGSECTLAAVVSDPDNHQKFIVGSFKLIPPYAVIDAELMVGLPSHITSFTGMDALTHAVEAYIGRIGTPYTDEMAEKAIKVILQDLETVYHNGADLERRNNLALASHYAGLAFTRANVGYVHAIAHTLGGMYGIPHGQANAIILPYILEYSKADCTDKLARLAIVGGLGDDDDESNEVLCQRFIEKVKEMNCNMDIPANIKTLEDKDIPLIAQRALEEGNPLYPVPTLMNQFQCETLLRELLTA